MRTAGIRVFVVFLVLLGLSSAAFAVSNSQPQRIDIAVDIPAMIVTRQSDGSVEIAIDGFAVGGQSAQPMLPVKKLFYALPPHVDPASVSVVVTRVEYDESALPGPVRPRGAMAQAGNPGAPWSYGNATNVVNGRDMDVYGRNAFFPAQPVRLTHVSRARRWRLADVHLSPVSYNPVTGTARQLRHIEFSLVYNLPSRAVPATASTDTAMDSVVFDLAENRDDAQTWYGLPRATLGTQPFAGLGYLIMTTDAIYTNSPTLHGLVPHKQLMGYTVRVVTETGVDGNSEANGWNELTGPAPDGKAERMRQFLQIYFAMWNLKYVLLIGNPTPDTGDLPMKVCYPENYASAVPTDWYYSDLSGSWNPNGDAYYGSFACDYPYGTIDFQPEVIVGRIPVYPHAHWQGILRRIILKTIAYEREMYPSWRKRALFGETFLDGVTDTAYLSEALKTNTLAQEGFASHTMYEQGGLSAYSGVTNHNSIFDSDEEVMHESMKQNWSSNYYGLVEMSCHGSSRGMGFTAGNLFVCWNAAALNDALPSLVFNLACSTGQPEDMENCGYSLLKNGAIASLTASRPTYYYVGTQEPQMSGASCHATAYRFCSRAASNHVTFGEANVAIAQIMELYNAGDWNNVMAYNLYGDPSLALRPVLPDDSDADGMPDAWETLLSLNPYDPQDAMQDIDGDGLANAQEYVCLSDPRVQDSDADGLSDGVEAQRFSWVNGTLTWEQSRTDALSRTGHLATITTEAEWMFIRASFFDVLQNRYTWLGASDAETEGTWKWVTGETWSFTRWLPGQPDAGIIQNYLAIWGEASTNLMWDDGFGIATAPGYLFERNWSSAPMNPDTDIDDIPDGWELTHGLDCTSSADGEADPDADELPNIVEYRSGADPFNPDSDGDGLTDGAEVLRYQLFGTYLTWPQARDQALSRGGHLATITSEEEWTRIQSLLGYALQGKYVWLGASDTEIEGVWKWVTGEPWSFTRWLPGQPDGGTSQNYLAIRGSAGIELLWDDGSSTAPYHLMEKDWSSSPTNPDTDGDGARDFDEVVAGTDPEDFGSALRTASLAIPMDPPLVRISWNLASGRAYSILYRDGLSQTGDWSELAGYIGITGTGAYTAELTLPGDVTHRLFKVRAER